MAAQAPTQLNVTVGEEYPKSTDIYQLGDGTLVYHKKDSGFPHWLYTKLNGKKVELKMPDRIKLYPTSVIAIHGNSIYILHDRKIFKALLSSPDCFTVSFVRDVREGETYKRNGVFTELRGERKVAYRISDDPENKVIEVEIDEENDSASLIGMIGDKVMYLRNSETWEYPSIHKWNENEFVVLTPYNFVRRFIHSASQPFLYATHTVNSAQYVHTLNLDSMEFKAPLTCSGLISIVGVHNGIITGTYKNRILQVQLPEGYFGTDRDTTAVNEGDDDEYDQSMTSSDPSLAISSFDNLIDQCCCSICTEVFDSEKFVPLVLDCGHTFCDVCINNVCENEKLNCPNCSTVTTLIEGKTLPKNFAMISMSEQVLESRRSSKSACSGCNVTFSSSSLCMCTKDGCEMLNKLLCLNCALDGGHGGHAVKYDEKVKQIRSALRVELARTQSRVLTMKGEIIAKTKKLDKISNSVRMKLFDVNIPNHLIDQIESISSDQDAHEYKEIVKDLEKTIVEKCEALTKILDCTLNAPELLEFLEDEDNVEACEE